MVHKWWKEKIVKNLNKECFYNYLLSTKSRAYYSTFIQHLCPFFRDLD